MKDIIKKILKEEFNSFNWVSDLEEPLYNGHPQGVVHVRNRGEIKEVCDILEQYNLLSCGEKGNIEGSRFVLNTTMDRLIQKLGEVNDDDYDDDGYYDPTDIGLSIGFFVAKPEEDRLTLSFWDYIIDDKGVESFFRGQRYRFYNSQYRVYNLHDFKKLFDIYLT